MPIDFAKYGISVKSLDAKSVVDQRLKGMKWPTWLVGNHVSIVTSFQFVPPSQETKKFAFFQTKLKIKDSTDKTAIGRTFPVGFVLNGDPLYQDLNDSNRASFVAACMKSHADDPSFLCEPAQDILLELEATGGFADESCCVYHTTSAKTKTKAVMVDGKPVAETKTHINHYFAPILT